MAVLRAVDVGQRVRRGDVALVRQLVDVEHARTGHGHPHRPQPGRHQRDVDEDALAGPLALEQGGADPAGHRHARLQVAEARAGHRRRELLARRRRADRRTRAPPVGDAVEAAPAGERAARALGGAPAVDDPRVARPDVLGLDAELCGARREQVGEEHVDLVDERHQDLADPRASAMSRPIARLPRLATSKMCDDPVHVGRHAPCRGVPGRVAGGGCSTLSTSAPQSARTAAGGRHEHVARHLEHTNAVERTRHDVPLSSSSAANVVDELIMMMIGAAAVNLSVPAGAVRDGQFLPKSS